MPEFFLGSYIVTIVGLISAYFWSEHVASGSGLTGIFIVLILAILEISLSFDNAVVNAMKLEKMSEKWRHRFLTWGIAIAVFGMRFLFPILVVSIFAHIDILTVGKIAISDANQYAKYLQGAHAPIVTFGGMFLIMLFLTYFINAEKEVHWIKHIEILLSKFSKIKGLQVIVSVIVLAILQMFILPESRVSVIVAGLSGIITFLLIDGVAHLLEKREASKVADAVSHGAKYAGLISFIYLEMIDASFSLDGVLGAFALSNDVIIITIGLAIGAMFVRSLTVLLVEKKTLAQFLYLENGAHWAIGALAVIMLVSTCKDVPEVVTGLVGLVFIIGALISSILHNKKQVK
jgi:hypothetical protein